MRGREKGEGRARHRGRERSPRAVAVERRWALGGYATVGCWDRRWLARASNGARIWQQL